MAAKNIFLQSPAQVNIVRTAIPSPTSAREVGDGMETEIQPKPISPQHITHPESRVSSGHSSPILSLSPRLSEQRSSVQLNMGQRSIDDSCSHNDSIPSPTPSDHNHLKTEKFLIEEKMALKDHLKIQVKVNQELKRLLVASIGEDMGFHYERIATEKAVIDLENEEFKKKLSDQDEEIERLNISCDVWRSKFLAGRVQFEELQDSLFKLQRQQREMDTAVRALIGEHRIRSEHLEEMCDTLKHLHDALQRGKEDSPGAINCDHLKGSSDERCLTLAHTISSQLIGSKRAVPSKTSGYKKYLTSWKKIAPNNVPPTDFEYEVKPTMAEKYVTQLLHKSYTNANPSQSERASNLYRRQATVAGRFHPNTKHENLTLSCCSKCKGDIHVV